MNKKSFYYLLTIMMVAMLGIGFTSCSNDDDDDPTTYTLKWNTPTDGVENVMLFEYTENGDKIGNHSVDNLTQNGSYKYTASEKAIKVKIYFDAVIGTLSSPRWVQQVYYLKSGTNTDIEVNGNTIIGRKEP